jgi:WD40 repeat protein
VPSDFFVTSLDWSADGSSIAVGTQDGYVAIHDSAAGKQHVRSSQVQPITVIDWSPDASQLFSGSWDSVVRIWPRDLQSPQLQHFMPLQPGTLEWNADQTLCVVNETHSGRQLELRDQNGRFVREFPLPYPQLTNVAWSPDGRWIAIAPDQTKAVSIWNAQDGTVTATVPLEESPAIQLAWNSQSNRLAIGFISSTLRFVDLSGKVSSITNLPHQPRSIDWKPNSSMLAVVYEQANTSHVLQFWDADSLQSLPLTIPVTGYLNRIRWCPIGNRFAILVNHQPLIWDVDLRRAAVCTGHPGSCVDLCWNPDGHHLATVGRDKTTKIWNADGDCLQTLTGHRGWLTRVQWGKTDHLITSELDWVQHRWNAKTGRLQQTFIWLPNQNFLSLGPTGEILYSSSDALSQIKIVVERPTEQQKHAVPEFCSWEEFERLLGFPPLRPSPLPN